MIRQIHLSSVVRQIRRVHQGPVKSFDFMKTITAEEANLKEIGFRKVGSKMVDASKLLNQIALHGDQMQYAYAPGLPDLPITKVLTAGSTDQILQLFQLEYNSLSPMEKLVILQKLQPKIDQSTPLLVQGAVDVFNNISGKVFTEQKTSF